VPVCSKPWNLGMMHSTQQGTGLRFLDLEATDREQCMLRGERSGIRVLLIAPPQHWGPR
jgi:hypothetical protein